MGINSGFKGLNCIRLIVVLGIYISNVKLFYLQCLKSTDSILFCSSYIEVIIKILK